MDTQQNSSILDVLSGWISGNKNPEITVNTMVDLENTTLLKIVGYSTLLVVGAIALNQWLLRATLRRFFAK